MLSLSSHSLFSRATLSILLASSFVATRAILSERDISTEQEGDFTNEGEAHDPLDWTLPYGAKLTDFKVGSNGDQMLSYITDVQDNSKIKQAIVMIHGKNRDGGNYYWIAQNALSNAVASNYPGADEASTILAAPEFFSEKYNLGQYTDSELAWGDVNAWQAGDVATHPQGTTSTAFDALDAVMEAFANQTTYPNLTNLTFVGHGGGGQLMQRYAVVGQESPRQDLNVRYVIGDPSTTIYWTSDRPNVEGLDLSNCPNANVWRYGFDQFNGTAQGLKTPQNYFAQYIKRQVVFMVGYQDTSDDGDQSCEAQAQGGQFRRDRNLLYWKILTNLSAPLYGNDAVVFPGDLPNHLPDWSNISHNQLNHKLIVVEYADHDPNAVFGSSEGQAALFDSFTSLDDNRGWRPYGYNDSRNSIVPYNPPQQENSPVDDGEESGSGKGGDLTSQNKTSGTSHLHGLAISSSLVIASLLGLTLLF